ncbi:hypothetical protein L1987_70241 [Smallanthus sonchifolius]|uniref:Uncharacterized protein n=1 Tax=Smallanthus sonchifolius TaxID=185202 RepID=A0ACB9ATC4_9ASTR|nr:hypothetical protein L1987_70241 [Smallanthus sonchifolius]
MARMKLSMKMFMMMMMMIMLASMQMHGSMAQTRHTFNAGDTLFFNFTTGIHDVAEVSQAAYDPCTTINPISITTTGPATVTLTTAGAHYYICTVGTHCQIGQKLAINVSATPAAPATPPPATPTPPPVPTPVSPPTTTPSPAPVPSTTTPPPTSSPSPSPVGANPPSPTTSGPSPSHRTTPSPPGDTTPPPSPSTAARSFTVVVPATFLAVALAFFY